MQPLVRPMLASLTVPEKRAPIDMQMPRVFMRTTETNLGHSPLGWRLSLVLREELTRRGFRFVEREQRQRYAPHAAGHSAGW
jgi:hypothetical protein